VGCKPITISSFGTPEDFKTFVREDLCPKLSQGKVVVMDNLKIYKSEEVQKMIRDTGAKPFYLPRYSPDFNNLLTIRKAKKYWHQVQPSSE
jgi:transposase